MKKYEVDVINGTITVSKDFLKKASVLGSDEYNIIMQYRKDYPGGIIEVAEQKKAPRACITFASMKAFIALCSDSEKRLADFEKIYALSKIQRSPYNYVLTWFRNNYANYDDANPQYDEMGNLIVKTKAQMEAEKKKEDSHSAESSAEEMVNDNTIPMTNVA